MTAVSDLIPNQLSYGDGDMNGKIDFITLTYPRALGGNIDVSQIELFSATGGLSRERISTQTGFVTGYSLSGNILTLTLLEQDLVKTQLRINSTTSSELRLKSSSYWGLTDLSGRPALALTLTTMLDGYRPDRIRHPDPIASTSSGSESIGTTS